MKDYLQVNRNSITETKWSIASPTVVGLPKQRLNQEKSINRNALGFHKPRMWDKIVHIEECHLQQEPGNEIRNFIHQYALDNGISYFDLKQKTGQLRSMMIRTATTGQIMLVIQFFEDQPAQREWPCLKQSLPIFRKSTLSSTLSIKRQTIASTIKR